MDYRLVINPVLETYSIQFKKRKSAHLAFLEETTTLEAKYTSLEGKVHVNPAVVQTINEKDRGERS